MFTTTTKCRYTAGEECRQEAMPTGDSPVRLSMRAGTSPGPVVDGRKCRYSLRQRLPEHRQKWPFADRQNAADKILAKRTLTLLFGMVTGKMLGDGGLQAFSHLPFFQTTTDITDRSSMNPQTRI